MILITTAGQVGAEAARLLAQRAEPVRVLVRDREKVAGLAQAGVEVAVGDLAVPASIDAAMHGVSAVVLVSPAIPAQELAVVSSAVDELCSVFASIDAGSDLTACEFLMPEDPERIAAQRWLTSPLTSGRTPATGC